MTVRAGVPVGMLTRVMHWQWKALTPGGVRHLVPPQPGRLATTGCWRPLRPAEHQVQLPLTPERAAPGRHCAACIAQNGGTVA